MKDLHDIIKAGLISEGYEGLYAEECGCGLDDLAPCQDGPDPQFCKPGYKATKDGVPWYQAEKPEGKPEKLTGLDECPHCNGPCEYSSTLCSDGG